MSALPDRLQAILKAENLTIYAAAQLVGAETGEPIKTIHERIRKWCKASPKSWSDIEVLLSTLGYEIKIERKNETD